MGEGGGGRKGRRKSFRIMHSTAKKEEEISEKKASLFIDDGCSSPSRGIKIFTKYGTYVHMSC